MWISRSGQWRRTAELMGVAVVATALVGSFMDRPLRGQSAAGVGKSGVSDTVAFAGGCFWSMQKLFDHVPGVVETTAGYEGGTLVKPTYEEVENGKTGHAETVRVVYDPDRVTYTQLVSAYIHAIDPTDDDGTFCDRGSQYRHIIFVSDSVQRQVAESAKAALAKEFGKPIPIQIAKTSPFTAAEAYHQEYYKKNPVRYELYRRGCGRDAALASAWKGHTIRL